MSTLNQRAEDTIVAALLAGFWSGMLMEKLDALTLKFNLPVLHVVSQWWPLLLIVSGVVLLFRHQRQAKRAPLPVEQRYSLVMRREEQANAR